MQLERWKICSLLEFQIDGTYFIFPYIFLLQRKNQLREAYSNNLWDGARKTLATLWDGHGAIWHGNAQQASII